jgi:8-oxo-dGTP diphosphatase
MPSMNESPASGLHSVSVSAVITNDAGQILVVRRQDNDRWEPPGGVLEPGESVVAGLRREIVEETGLIVEPLGLTGVYKNMTEAVVALVFRAAVVGGTLVESNDEVAQADWLTPDAVIDACTRAYSVRILDALAGRGPAVRAHDGTELIVER